jgi:hypothetical protein
MAVLPMSERALKRISVLTDGGVSCLGADAAIAILIVLLCS